MIAVLEYLVYPLIALLFVAVFTREVIAPASRNLCDRRWLIYSSALGADAGLHAGAGLVAGRPDSPACAAGCGRTLEPAAGGLAELFITSFVFYWWHRATHASDLLWRVFHQLHHSARRIEVLTSFYAHPLDSCAAMLLSVISSYWVLGASPAAAAVALGLTAAFDLFTHADIRTPRWLGYVLQRRKCIPCTISMATMRRTTACRYGTCCSAPGPTRRACAATGL